MQLMALQYTFYIIFFPCTFLPMLPFSGFDFSRILSMCSSLYTRRLIVSSLYSFSHDPLYITIFSYSFINNSIYLLVCSCFSPYKMVLSSHIFTHASLLIVLSLCFFLHDLVYSLSSSAHFSPTYIPHFMMFFLYTPESTCFFYLHSFTCIYVHSFIRFSKIIVIIIIIINLYILILFS